MHKVLVIEDDRLSLKLMLKTLRRAGFDAMGAENGTSGVTLARNHRPDLIISDVRMDEKDGYAALSEIRNDVATATIPFILMTGQASKEGMRHGMELGADDYLTKPFKVDELLAAVNARLKKQKTTQAVMQRQLKSLRDTISSAVPREVRDPLSVIVSCAQALRTHASALRPQDVVKMANAIDGAGHRLLQLFEKFMLYSYLEVVAADPDLVAEVRAERTDDVASVLETRLREVAEMHERSHDLVVDLQPGVLAMRSDYLERIVEELAGNAFKFSEACTSVVVHSSFDDEVMTLSIEDYGHGMEAGQIESVDAFIQFDRSEQEQSGLGLGLSIVSRLVDLHGGLFTVQSSPGQGTVAIVKLPAAG